MVLFLRKRGHSTASLRIDISQTIAPPPCYKVHGAEPQAIASEYERGEDFRDKAERKEGGSMEAGQGKKVGGGMRSETEKEKTKMRERKRRSITTNIFHGLRKHGGYRLSTRADINEVLRFLATEAGWIVEPDGTTYRSSASVLHSCPFCGAFRSVTPTGISGPIVGGGECSTTSSPRRFPIPLGEYSTMINHSIAKGIPLYCTGTITSDSTAFASSSCSSPNIIDDAALALYMYDGIEGGVRHSDTFAGGGASPYSKEVQDGERAGSEKTAEGSTSAPPSTVES